MKIYNRSSVPDGARKINSTSNHIGSACLVLLMVGLLVSSGLQAQSFITNAEKLGVDGTVYDAVSDGTYLYIGGDFTRVGERTPYGAITDGTSADVISGNPEPNDVVRIVKPDGSGGFYLSGDFTEIGGVSRAGLAHVSSTGTVTAWDPGPNGAVSAMAVVGSTVYVGGSFSTIGGQSRSRLAALNSSGDATTWDPSPDISVTVLEADANYVYVAGNFTTIGGQSRTRLAQISTSTGNASSWDPAPNSAPLAMKLSGSTLYVGGSFTTIAGVSQDRMASFNTSTGALNSWDPNPSGTVYDIEIYGTDVIVAGQFNQIGTASRSRLAALDASTATATSWNPNLQNSAYDLAIDGDILYVAGIFFGLSNQPRHNLAAWDMSATTPTLQDWNPGISTDGSPLDIAAGGGNVYVGGSFTGIGGERRLGLAAINLSDLSLDDFAVDVAGYYGNSSVYALELVGSALAVGGDFTTVGGETRNSLATISLTTETTTSWTPLVGGAFDDVNKLLLSDDGSTLYIAGAFTSFNGTARNRAAAIDVAAGTLTSWNPDLNNTVNDIFIEGSSIYLAGQFTTAGGTTRNRIVEVNDTDGAITSWDPNLNNTAYAVEVGSDGNVYVGGDFTAVGSDTRQRLAAINPTTGSATTWVANTGGIVYDMYATQSLLYVGGAFTFTGGVNQRYSGAYDVASGTLTSWNPTINPSGSSIRTILPVDENVFLFGTFNLALLTDVANGTAVTRANDAPFDILLSNNSINENIFKSSVGTLSSTDDSGDTHTYSLVEGDGDDDNRKFAISGTSLKPDGPLDYETDPNPSVRVRSTDQNGYYSEKVFSITVNNVIESETDITAFSISGQTSSAIIDDASHTVTVSLAPGTDVTSILPNIEVNTSATYSPQTAQDFTSPVEYTVTAEDGSTQVWTVTVRSPLSGIYSVKTGGDFETMSLAVSYLNTHGIGADVTFEIDGFHSLSTIVGRYPGTTEHSLTITPASAASVATFSNRLTFQGTENVIISGDDLLLFNHSPNSGTAIKLEDDPITNDPSNNILIENTLFKSDAYCIWVQNGHNLEVRGNVFTPYAVTSGSLTALLGNGDLADISFHNNEVYFNETNGANGPAYGVSMTALTGTLNVENNVIALNTQDYSSQYGVFISGAIETVNINHNTILTGFNTPTESATVYGIRLLGDPSTALTIKNNIIVMGDLFSGTKTGIDYSPGEITLDVSDNNISSTGGGTMRYALLYGTVYDDTNFTTLQGIIDGTTNSTVAFTDETNLDFSLAGTSLNDADLRGVPVPGITSDIVGATRSSFAPSKGAYETDNTITDIFGFDVDGQIGDAVIDDVNHTVSAETSSSVISLTPTIDVMPGADASPSAAQDFTTSVTYTVTAEAGNTQDWEVSITQINADPTEVELDNNSVAENVSIGTVIGTLTSVDANTSDSYTYTLVAGTGDDNNGQFTIDVDQLKTNAAINFEDGSPLSILVRTDDGNGGTLDQQLDITVTNVVESPTDIELGNSVIVENNSVDDVIGALTTTDEDNGETYTYSLLDDTSYPDNTSFAIDGSNLIAGVVFDHEAKESYTIQLQTNDGNGETYAEEFTITIDDESEVPTGILLTSSLIAENNSIDDVIGVLSTDDQDEGESYIYSLVDNGFYPDNTSFSIDGANLVAEAAFDHESQGSYSIKIQTNDQNGGTYSKTFVITISDVTETPTDIDLDVTSIDENNSVDAVIGVFTATDEDESETYTYTLTDNGSYPDNTSFDIVDSELIAKEMFDYEGQSSYTINVQVSDGSLTYSEEFTIMVVDDESESLIWNGTVWMNGTPGAGSDDVIIDGNYNTADHGTIDVNSITINSGNTYTVAVGDYLYVGADIINNGSLVIESGGDLMSFQTGSITGNDIIIKRNTRYADGRYSFVGTPVQQTANVTNATLGSHVYSYDESQSYDPNDGLDRWIAVSGELVPGVGYTQALQQEITFEGVPNVGDVSVMGTYSGTYNDATNEETEGWLFVSNPYATAIDVADFLGPNTNIEGAVYIWDDNGSDNGRGSNSDYIIANGTVATNTTNAGGQTRYNSNLGSAQGFFVKLADDSDTEVSFTPDMRVTGSNSDDNFFRTAGTPAYVRINLTSESGLFKQAIIGRIAGISDETLDRSFDAKVFSSKATDLIYTIKNEKALAIQGISYEREAVPLAFNVSEAGIYTIGLDLTNAQGENFYLKDHQTGEVADLSVADYSFSSSAGQFTDRFELVNNARVLGVDDQKIQIYAHDQTIHINMPKGEEKTFQLISIDGQQLMSRKLNRSAQIQTNLPAGVYIITDGEHSHKIILK